MKKVLIVIGGIIIACVLIGIGNVIATNMMPEYLAPIRVTCGGLMTLVLIIPFGISFAFGTQVKDKKGKTDKGRLAVVVGLEIFLVVLGIFMGTRAVGAIADMINGPTEKTVYFALIKEERDWAYRRGYSTEYFLEAVSKDGETREKIRLRVIDEDYEEVYQVLADAKWDYDIRAKYKLRYFENIKIVYELEAIPID